MREATPAEIARILSEHAPEVLGRFSLRAANMYMPTDGRGPRIRLSVEADAVERLPTTFEFVLDGEEVRVPLEVAADYTRFETQG